MRNCMTRLYVGCSDDDMKELLYLMHVYMEFNRSGSNHIGYPYIVEGDIDISTLHIRWGDHIDFKTTNFDDAKQFFEYYGYTVYDSL